MPGRKPLPDSIKATRGTLQKCRKRGTVNISASESIPQPPDDFTDLEKKLYFDTASELFTAGLFQKIGIAPLLMYCSYMATAIEAEQFIRKQKRIYIFKTRDGDKIPKINPYHKISIECFNAARSIMSEYGITPSAQARLAGIMKQSMENNPIDDIINS